MQRECVPRTNRPSSSGPWAAQHKLAVERQPACRSQRMQWRQCTYLQVPALACPQPGKNFIWLELKHSVERCVAPAPPSLFDLVLLQCQGMQHRAQASPPAPVAHSFHNQMSSPRKLQHTLNGCICTLQAPSRVQELEATVASLTDRCAHLEAALRQQTSNGGGDFGGGAHIISADAGGTGHGAGDSSDAAVFVSAEDGSVHSAKAEHSASGLFQLC